VTDVNQQMVQEKVQVRVGEDMELKEIIKSQYGASLEMLRQAILKCPDSLWHDPEYKNQFWHIAFHVIFYTHFYLHLTEDVFVPWEKHKQELVPLGGSTNDDIGYNKDDVLEYLELCTEQLAGHVDAVTYMVSRVSNGCRLPSWSFSFTTSGMSTNTRESCVNAWEQRKTSTLTGWG
jgi:hypothetical protein